MSMQTFQETLVVQTIQGTLFNTYTTSKTVIPPTCLIELPPNYLRIGKRLRITVEGAISNIVTTPGTITFEIKVGSVVAWSSGAVQLNATAHTLIPFKLVVDLTLRAEGDSTTAKFIGQGHLIGKQFTLTAGQTDDANTPGAFMVPATSPALGTGFDSTVANVLDFWTGFSISNAGNGIQVEQYTVEALN